MDSEVKKKITVGSLELYFKYGTQCISVDDICKHLCISKKSFYQYFENKNDNIKNIIKEFIAMDLSFNREISKGKMDVFDKILKIYEKMHTQFKKCNPRFFHDLYKYNRDAFKLFIEFENGELEQIIKSLLCEGKEKKLFREDIDEHLVYKFQIDGIRKILDGSVLDEITDSNHVFKQFILSSLIGISTLKGHKIMERKLKNSNQ